MDRSLTFTRFVPSRESELLPQVIACFQRVFASAPWSEWRRCTVCGRKWGSEYAAELTQQRFQHCGRPLEEFWSYLSVLQHILEEVPGGTCWIARSIGSVVGFTWGVLLDAGAIETKLALPGIASRLLAHFSCDGHLIAYQSELGVLPEWRGRKIAKELVRRRLADFLDAGASLGVVRTKIKPPTVTYLWYRRLGYAVVGEYHDEDRRVILAHNLRTVSLGRPEGA